MSDTEEPSVDDVEGTCYRILAILEPLSRNRQRACLGWLMARLDAEDDGRAEREGAFP